MVLLCSVGGSIGTEAPSHAGHFVLVVIKVADHENKVAGTNHEYKVAVIEYREADHEYEVTVIENKAADHEREVDSHRHKVAYSV